MKNLLVFLLIWLIPYLIGFICGSEKNNDLGFMSRTHANICRAFASIVVVFQHASEVF